MTSQLDLVNANPGERVLESVSVNAFFLHLSHLSIIVTGFTMFKLMTIATQFNKTRSVQYLTSTSMTDKGTDLGSFQTSNRISL